MNIKEILSRAALETERRKFKERFDKLWEFQQNHPEFKLIRSSEKEAYECKRKS